MSSPSFGVVRATALVAALVVSGPIVVAQDVGCLSVRVSVKRVVDATSTSPWTNQQIQTWADDADRIFRRDLGFGLRLTEIVDMTDPGVPASWFNFPVSRLADMEQAAQASPRAYAWRTDAINVYLVNSLLNAGGICSFTNGPTQEIIVVQRGILGGSAGLAHEIGHYFNLRHTHANHEGAAGSCAGGVAGDCVADTRDDANPFLCNPFTTGCHDANFVTLANAGGYTPLERQRILDNVMSYHGAGSARALFTPGQGARARETLFEHRSHVLDGFAATSWGPNRLDVFSVAPGGRVMQQWFNGGWAWSDLGNGFGNGGFVGPLTATSSELNRIDVFGLDSAGDVRWLSFNAGWQWNNLGNGLGDNGFVGPLAATSWGPGRLDVFGVNRFGHVVTLWFDGAWHWTNLGNGFAGARFAGPLTAASWGVNRIDVFGLDETGNVRQLWFDGVWHWSNLGNGYPAGAGFVGPLAATSWAPGRLDVFGVSRTGDLLQLWFDVVWHWSNLGNHFASGRFAGSLTATAWGPGRLDVFGVGSNNTVLQAWHRSGFNWSNLGSACSYGAPCQNLVGSPRLGATTTVTIGNQYFALRLRGAQPNADATVGIGFEPADLPLPVGLCRLLVMPVTVRMTRTDGSGNATVPLPLPADPALHGLQLFTQGVVFDTTGTSATLTTTVGLRLTIG